jgi:hypothetical protein
VLVVPPGREEVVICTAVTAAFTAMLRLAVLVCAGELESVTLTVNEEVPAAVGVPLITPEVLSVNPAGKDPELIDQLYGVVPPVAANVDEYEVPAVPPGREEVVICTAVTEAVTVMLRLAVAVCAGELESVTLTVNEEVPAVVGVPLITPEVLSVRPAGNEPELTDQVYGVVPPLAATVAE